MPYAQTPNSVMSNMTQAPGEERNPPPVIMKRTTKGGRALTYEIRVIQQPLKARACGSGPKSSADRRPVDPPPVLEFRIFEDDSRLEEGRRDITFDYNADFFVYASLEHSRPIAHPRGQGPTPPVLTGFPVAGCCYFDRPSPAAYFVFPDLSVRHEGRYKLVFSLYEQIKNDQDEELRSQEIEGQGFYHRMEVRSDDFTVFSAKKFPGLSTSTHLSRTVAEQGCRVRIRRDVRMRRRDTKSGAGNGDANGHAEDEYARHIATRTPDLTRARSASNSSVDLPYGMHQRKGSNTEYSNAPSPWVKGNANSLDFGGSSAGAGFAPPILPSAHHPSISSHRASPLPTAYGHVVHGAAYTLPPSPTSPSHHHSRTRSSSIHELDPKLPVMGPNSHLPRIAPRPESTLPPPTRSPCSDGPYSKKRQHHDAFTICSSARNVQGSRPTETTPVECSYRKSDGSLAHVNWEMMGLL